MSTQLMAPRKNKRNNASMAIAKAIIDEYQPTNAEEMPDALKDIFGPMFEAMLFSHLYPDKDQQLADQLNQFRRAVPPEEEFS